nr:methyl-accepting chemotaxis protein [uncultured Rhodoferax sp.]
MSNRIEMSPQLKAFLAAPEAPDDGRNAFSVHGIWAPGVQFMRRVSFRSKALIITALFLIPLFYAGYAFVTTQQSQINFSSKELVGLAYAKELTPMLGHLQRARELQAQWATLDKEPAEMGAARNALEQQMQKVLQAQKAYGAELGITTQADELNEAVTALPKSAPGKAAGSVMKSYAASFAKAISLLDVVLDTSNLVLDPDIDTYYLMDASMGRMPLLIETTARLRDLSLDLVSGREVTKALGREIGEAEGLSDYLDAAVMTGLGKIVGVHPEHAQKLNFKPAMDAAHTLHDKANLMLESPDNKASAAEILALGDTAVKGMLDEQVVMMELLGTYLEARVSALRAKLYSGLTIITLSLLLACYAFYAFFVVSRGGLQLISRHLQEVSTGDLRTPPRKPLGSDEPAQVILDLRIAYNSLHELIRKVRHSARALHAAAGEISAASLDLGSRTEDAASALQVQASAMEEIGSTVQGTAQHAAMAATFAVDNAHVAERGGTVFQEVVVTMREIHTSSSKIGDIIGVIDGIAFQTNILALNAAVEAARAGEAGRGFAVVASEVRTLAQRSAAAAREIKSLISDSVEKVEGGTKIVEAAGLTMTEVVTNARQINQFLGEIATACREQAIGVSAVGQSIQELDKNTQQNAALVEETNAAAAALTAQADVLQDEIANFRVA